MSTTSTPACTDCITTVHGVRDLVCRDVLAVLDECVCSCVVYSCSGSNRRAGSGRTGVPRDGCHIR